MANQEDDRFGAGAAEAGKKYIRESNQLHELKSEKAFFEKQERDVAKRINEMPKDKANTPQGERELAELQNGRDILNKEIDSRQSQINSIEQSRDNATHNGQKVAEPANDPVIPPPRVGGVANDTSQPKLNETLTNRETKDWNQETEPNSLNEASKSQAKSVTNSIEKYSQQGQETRKANENRVEPNALDTSKEAEQKGNSPHVDAAKEKAQQPQSEQDQVKGNEKGNDLDQER